MFNDEAAFQSWSTTFKILYSATFSSFDFSDFENLSLVLFSWL